MAELPIAIQCGRGAPAGPPLDSGFRRSDELGGYPGSWSGTCFRTNRSCRLAPAHQGMKSRSCGLVQRIGAADSATPHPDPSGGQAPALHSPLPTPLDSGLRRNDGRGVAGALESRLSAFSYQSLIPAGAGTPRCEKLELWLGTANWHPGFCHAPPPPQRGTSPRTTFPSPHPSGFPLSRE